MVFNFFDKHGGRPRFGSSKPFKIFQRCCLCHSVDNSDSSNTETDSYFRYVDLKAELAGGWIRLVAYFFAFLVICAVWESHVHRFMILSHIDDVLIWLNLASLMFTPFLPFACALEGKYPEKFFPVLLMCSDMAIMRVVKG